MKKANLKESSTKKKIFAFVLFAIGGVFLGTLATISGQVEAVSVAVVIIGSVALVFGILGVFYGQKWADRLFSWLVYFFNALKLKSRNPFRIY